MGFFFFAVRRVSWQGIYFLLVNEIILPSHEWLCQRLHSTVFVSLNFLDDWVLVLEGWHTGVVLYARNASTTWVRRIFKASVGGVSYRINWRMYVVLISFWQPAWRILYTGRAVGKKVFLAHWIHFWEVMMFEFRFFFFFVFQSSKFASTVVQVHKVTSETIH